jgi:AcrR family transcriptional regulator
MVEALAPKGAQTRRRVLDAAVARFGRDGYRATAVADIARDAGVGGTVTYAYFPNKEALFLAAIDEDAAAVIEQGLSSIVGRGAVDDWRQTLIFTLIDAVERHPALNDLRKACAERIAAEQLGGAVRHDIDAVRMGNGMVSIMLSLLMSVVQIGRGAAVAYGPDVAAVFEAALDAPPKTPR